MQIFNEALRDAPPGSFPRPVMLVVNAEVALAGRTEARACAAADENTVYVHPKLLRMPAENQVGVILHELSHVSLLQRGHEKHTEREADKLAEQFWGYPISYDKDDIQTIGSGKRPRPAYLERN